MTGRVDILWRIFEKIAKKFLVNLSENVKKIYCFGSCYFNFNFFCSFLKNAPYFINPFGNFVFF